MVQVTPNPRDGDPKMSEEKRVKEAPGGAKTPKPEVHNVRFEWAALPTGQGSDILAYKNQRRQGDVPQGVQTVPAVWVPSPQAPWQYSGVTEDSLVSQSETNQTVMEWFGVKEVVACSGLITLLIMLLRYLERSRVLSRLRPRRWQVQNTKVEVICQVQDELPSTRLPSKPSDASNGQDMPPSYSKIDLNVDGGPQQNDILPPYACIFTTGKNKVPHVLIYDPRNEKDVMDKMHLSSSKGQPSRKQNMKVNVPTKADVNDPKKERANFVIEINDTENDSGCVIGMDVLVDKNHKDAIAFDNRDGIPFNIKLEQLKSKDPKQIKKSKKDGKK